MKKPVNIAFILILAFVILQVYTLIHEGAHALMAKVFGGTITAFDVNLFGGNPHVRYAGDFSSLQRALISFAGPFVPVLLWFVFLIFLNRQKSLIFQKIAILASIGILGTMVPNIIIAVVYETGGNVSGEDMGKFLANTGLNGIFIAAGVSLILGTGIWLFFRKVKFLEALKYQFPVPNRF